MIDEGPINVVVRLSGEANKALMSRLRAKYGAARASGPTRPAWSEWIESYEGKLIYTSINDELLVRDFDTSRIAKLVYGRGRSTQGRPRQLPMEMPKIPKARADELANIIQEYFGLPAIAHPTDEPIKAFWERDENCANDFEQAVRNMYMYADYIPHSLLNAVRLGNQQLLRDLYRVIPEAFKENSELRAKLAALPDTARTA